MSFLSSIGFGNSSSGFSWAARPSEPAANDSGNAPKESAQQTQPAATAEPSKTAPSSTIPSRTQVSAQVTRVTPPPAANAEAELTATRPSPQRLEAAPDPADARAQAIATQTAQRVRALIEALETQPEVASLQLEDRESAPEPVDLSAGAPLRARDAYMSAQNDGPAKQRVGGYTASI